MKKIIDFLNHPITNFVVGVLLYFCLFFVYEPLKTSGELHIGSCFLGAGMVISSSIAGYGLSGMLDRKKFSDQEDLDE